MPQLPPGGWFSFLAILRKPTLRMLPEVCPSVAMRFQLCHTSLNLLCRVTSIENKPLGCYKSDLRHALNFAYT